MAEDVEDRPRHSPAASLACRVTKIRVSDVTASSPTTARSLRAGSLQKLIEDVLAAPHILPGPQVTFERATVRLATPAGARALAGNGVIDDSASTLEHGR